MDRDTMNTADQPMDGAHAFNEPRRKKVDISSKVTGKLREDKMIFEVEGMEIGQMALDNREFEFHEEYGMENHKIYQIQVEGAEESHYVEGCDMGWC